MSDFSFMKSGVAGEAATDSGISEIEIVSLLTVFVENAMKTAAKHVNICRRNGVTCEDITYGLIYEVFNWLKRSNLIENFKETKEEFEKMVEEESEDEEEDSDYEEISEHIVPDEHIEKFTRCEAIEGEHEEFLRELYQHYDNWDTWVPSNPIENALKNGVDTVLKTL